MKNCINCEIKLTHLTNQNLTANFKTANGIKKLNLTGLSFKKCNKCGEIFFDSKDSKIHDKQLIKALEENRKKKGLLTAKEIKQIREERNLTQEELEKLLRISPKNVARWETYKSDQSQTADLLLRMLKNNPICFEFINKNSIKNKKDVTILFIKTMFPDYPESELTEERISKFEKIISSTINKEIQPYQKNNNENERKVS